MEYHKYKNFLILLFSLVFSVLPLLNNNTFAVSKPKITITFDYSEITKGDRIKLSGKISPKKKGTSVYIYRRYTSQSHYKKIKTVKTGKTGKYSYSLKLSSSAYFYSKAVVNGKVVKSVKTKVYAVSVNIKGGKPDGIINDDRIFDSLTVSPTNPNIIYVGTEGNGIFKSTDGGIHWAWLRKGLRHTNHKSGGNTYGEVYDIRINPANQSIVYAALTLGPEVPDRYSIGGLYKSTNGGSSWQKKMKGVTNASINSLALDPQNPNIIYIGTNGEHKGYGNKVVPGSVFKSVNAGESWSKLPTPTKGLTNKFHHIETRTGLVFALASKWKDLANGSRQPDLLNSLGLIKSADGGRTWQNITPASSFPDHFDVSADGQTIYAVGVDGVGYKSVDGGAHWSTIWLSYVVKMLVNNSNIVFFSNLRKSTDGLATYNTVLTPPGSEYVNDVEIAKSNSNIVYAGTSGYLIYKSANSGNSFTRVANLRSWIDKQP